LRVPLDHFFAKRWFVADGSPVPKILERNIFTQRFKKKLDTDLELMHLLLPATKVKYAAPCHFVKVITG